MGRILQVDLSNGKVHMDPLNMDWAGKFIGGKGLAARYLYEYLKPKTDPLSPENVLIIMTGPVLGTDPHPPAAGKGVVVTKSPATNAFLDSYFGGNFMADLKFAGFDGIIIRGKAKELSYLYVKDGEAEIRVSKEVKHKGTYDTTSFVQKEIGDEKAKVAVIGPAGENLVKFACITLELNHHAGRGGAGCVMGSKNLKAIAVRGTKKPKVSNPGEWNRFVKETIKKEIFENAAMEMYFKAGTPGIVELTNNVSLLPTRNFQDGVFEHANKIDWDALKEKAFVKKAACYRCPVACRNLTEIREGKFKGLVREGPEYETLALAGSNCGIDSLYDIMRFNYLCADYGLDTISAGNTIAFVMECLERGIVSKEEVGGLDLSFGSVNAYLELLKLIAFREGIGDVLAEGVREVSRKFGRGSERFAMQVKGLEYPGYEPRGSFGMALAYATSDRGACHLRAWPVAYDAMGNQDPFTNEKKAELVIGDQNLYSIKWSMIFCDFYPIGYPTISRFYSLATGKEITEEEAKLIGERIWNLIRLFNVREGFTRKDDTFPARIAEDPLLSGPAKGRVVPRELFDRMLDEYYQLRGWTNKGIPTPEKLQSLGLSDLATK